MTTAKTLCGFFARCMFIFVVLMLLWPAVGASYAGMFQSAGNALVGFGSHGRVSFSAPTDVERHRDTEVVILDREAGRRRSGTVSSRRHGFMPTAFLLGLILATPVTWPRRARAVLFGLFWVHCYLALKLVLLAVQYGVADGPGPLAPEQFLKKCLLFASWIVSGSYGGWAIAPLLIWGTVTLRRQDWAAFTTAERDDPGPAARKISQRDGESS